MIEEKQQGICDFCGKENTYVQRLLNEIRWKDNTYDAGTTTQSFYKKELWICQNCRNDDDKIKKRFFEEFRTEINQGD